MHVLFLTLYTIIWDLQASIVATCFDLEYKFIPAFDQISFAMSLFYNFHLRSFCVIFPLVWSWFLHCTVLLVTFCVSKIKTTFPINPVTSCHRDVAACALSLSLVSTWRARKKVDYHLIIILLWIIGNAFKQGYGAWRSHCSLYNSGTGITLCFTIYNTVVSCKIGPHTM